MPRSRHKKILVNNCFIEDASTLTAFSFYAMKNDKSKKETSFSRKIFEKCWENI